MGGEVSADELKAEIATLRERLDEAQQTLRAISEGQVDAFVMEPSTERVEIRTTAEAQRPYQLLVERMQQGAVTVSADGLVLYANQRFAAILRTQPGSLLGTDLRRLISASEAGRLAALLHPQAGATAQSEFTLWRADGGVVHVLMAVVFLTQSGAVCLIVTDLTEQRRHQWVIAAEALGRSILDQAVDSIVVCNAEGRVIRASRTGHQLCGRSPLRRRFLEVFPLTHAGAALDLGSVMGGQVMKGLECQLQRRSGERRTLLVSAGPVTDDQHRRMGCVITMTDITERKHAEERLREADVRKDEFLAILAHELRNPLAPIRNGLQLLKLKTGQDPLVRQTHAMVERQVEQLVRLIDDLLDLSRISRGKMVLRKESTTLRAVIERAVEASRPGMEARQHRLHVELPAEDVALEADPARLAQVFSNLLSNSAKYTERGGEIGIKAWRDGGQVVVAVKDDGIGIPGDMLSRIFEMFTQVDAALERSEGGLGIGLTLVKRLTEMHDGAVEVWSDGPGRGSEFRVRLPCLRGAPQLPAAAAGTRSAAQAHGQRILIADDNRDAAFSLALLLEAMGHEVRAVYDGQEATLAGAAFHPSVMILDIGMPRLNGYEAARRIREQAWSSGVVLVALTGWGQLEDKARAREAGFDHHLTKPVNLPQLEAILDDARQAEQAVRHA